MNRLPQGLRSILFVACNVIAAIVLYGFVIAPYIESYRSVENAIQQRRLTLAQLKAVAARQSEVAFAQEGLAEFRDEVFTGQSEELIAADLQSRIKTIASSAGAQVRIVRSLPSRTSGGMTFIGSQFELNGTVAAVARLAYELDAAAPYFFINAATLRVPPHQLQQATRTEPTIDVQLDVMGAAVVGGLPQ